MFIVCGLSCSTTPVFGYVELIGPETGIKPKIEVVKGIVKAQFGFKTDDSSSSSVFGKKFKSLCVKVCLYVRTPGLLDPPKELKCDTFTITRSDVSNNAALNWRTKKSFASLSAKEDPKLNDYFLRVVEAKPCPDSGTTMALMLLGVVGLVSSRKLL